MLYFLILFQIVYCYERSIVEIQPERVTERESILPNVVIILGEYICCTGFVIDDHWVISAAHCVQSNISIHIVYTHKKVFPSSVHIHPKYKKNKIGEYDAALLSFKCRLIPLQNNVFTLAGQTMDENQKDCQVFGFRLNLTVVLMYHKNISVLIGKNSCPCFEEYINERLICADNSICPIDRGSVLVCNKTLYGIGHFSYTPQCSYLSLQSHPFGQLDCVFVYLKTCFIQNWAKEFLNNASTIPKCSHTITYNWFILLVFVSILSMIFVYTIVLI